MIPGGRRWFSWYIFFEGKILAFYIVIFAAFLLIYGIGRRKAELPVYIVTGVIFGIYLYFLIRITPVSYTHLDVYKRQLVDSASQEDEIERVFREADSREALRQAMEHLSEEEKILLAERYGRERSFAEIAELLNISESACRKRLQRTKAHLAALLDPQSRSDQRRKAETRKGGEYHDGQDAKS